MDANNASILSTQVTASAFAVWIIQKLKQWKWFTALNPANPVMARIFSVGAAVLTAAGISYTWSKAPGGGHTLLLAIPSFAGFLLALWHVAQQFVFNETIYQATVNKLSVTTAPAGPATPAKVTPAGAVVVPPANP